MRFDRYCGMASAVGIVLILTMVTWLDLWGPVNIANLQPWQTLLTGFLAVFAAVIAYIGATAKVRFDREVRRQDVLQIKIALFFKLTFALENIVTQATACRKKMKGTLFTTVGVAG
jgi:hypothetical protein